MLRGIDYAQQDVATFLQPDVTMFGDQAATFSEAEQEVLAFVQGNNRQGLRTTMLSLTNHFEHKPYGWYLAAIQGIVAKLLARGKLEIQRDAHILEGDELERALLNSRGYANLVVEPQIEFTAGQLRGLREFYGEFFDRPTATNEAKSLGRETSEAFRDLREDLVRLQRQAGSYPFLEALREPVQQLGEVTNQRYTFYLTELRRVEDTLFDLKEQVIDPVRRFMSGAQREIYDEARRFLEREQDNFVYLEGDEVQRLRQILADPQVYRGNQMQAVKRLLDALEARVAARVAEERERIVEKLRTIQERLEQTEEFAALTDEERSSLRAPFDALAREIERHRLIAVMRDSLNRFHQEQYPRLLQQMTAWAAPPVEEPEEAAVGGVVCREPAPEYVSRTALHVPFAKPWLGDAEDVEAYLDALRQALLEAIEAGKRVQL
jgi:hypothetical protein